MLQSEVLFLVFGLMVVGGVHGQQKSIESQTKFVFYGEKYATVNSWRNYILIFEFSFLIFQLVI